MNPKTRPERLVVIGGSAAGMSAASKARRLNSQLQVFALEKTAHVSYSACGIPYYIADLVRTHNELIAMTPGDFKSRRGIDVFTQHQVVAINPAKRTITAVELGANKDYELNYDKLVIAVGGKPARPAIKGMDCSNVFSVQTLEDGINIRQFVDSQKPGKAVLIGGGYIALEMAEALARRDLQVTIVEKADRLLTRYQPVIAATVQSELSSHGVRTLTGVQPEEIVSDAENSATGVLLCDGSSLDCGIVIICAGLSPATDLAQQAGARLGRTGAIVVDQKMHTTVPNVFAAGDCVEVRNLVSGKPDYIPLGTTANKQGRVAGENIGGGTARFRGVVGTSVFKLFDLEIARTGLSTDTALEAGLHPESVTVQVSNKASYFLGSSELTIALIFDKRNDHLLGAQMSGKQGVSKRIDVFAAALINRMKLQEMTDLDLSYAPPFAPVWDPVLVAVNAARSKSKR